MKQQVASPSKVDTIIKALAGLEDDIDSLNVKIADMKKAFQTKVDREIEDAKEKTIQIAQKEAEEIISQAREKAGSESERILKSGEKNLAEIKKQIDAKFDQAVDYVVSTILKP